MNFLRPLLDYYRYLQDKQCVNGLYETRFNQKINWQHPRGFNEKIQMFKITKKAEQLWPYVDKYEVRKFVEKQIGAEYLAKLYGIFDRVEDIQLDELPNSFVLKATHGSGWNILCPDKKNLNWPEAKQKLSEWLKLNYYFSFGRERQYKKIPPRIICEEFLNPEKSDLSDYKIFCFQGKPYMIQVDVNRHAEHKRNFYDPEWNLLDLQFSKPNTEKPITKPKNLEKMIEVATQLAAPFHFVRVDLYNVDGKIYFGELTFTPGNGGIQFKPVEYDRIFGKLFVGF
jgi:hypothetical protein